MIIVKPIMAKALLVTVTFVVEVFPKLMDASSKCLLESSYKGFSLVIIVLYKIMKEMHVQRLVRSCYCIYHNVCSNKKL